MAYKRSNFPETYDVFVEKLDLPASKLPLIEEYHTLYTKEVKTDEEKVRLNVLMKDLESHLYTPEHINHFQDAMTNVQKFFVENTSVYVQRLQDETTAHMDSVKLDATTHVDNKKAEIDTYTDLKQQEINLEVLKLQHQGTYSPTTTYFSKNIVDYTVGSVTQLYMCIKDNTVGKAPTTALNWLKLTIQGARGEKGTDGVGLLFNGKYNELNTYNKDDGIQYGGIMFASLKANNKGNVPNISKDTEWWGKAIDVTVTVTQKSSVVVIDYDTDNVPFLNSDITAFNKNTDTLEVYQNSTRLTRGVDYVLNADNSSIDKVDDIWLGNSEPVFFEFVVTLNMINDLVFSSGTSIADGTINKSKLTVDVQNELNSIDGKIELIDDKVEDIVVNKMPILTESIGLNTSNIAINSGDIGDKQQLVTKNKDSMVNAINEVSAKIDDLSFSSNAINFAGTSLNEGAQIKLNWTNKTDSTLENNELFVSTGDISNATVEHCRINEALIYEGVNEIYTHSTSKNILYYFKLFTTYSIGGVRYVSTGVTTQVLSEDLTPPAKVTGIELTTGDAKASMIYMPPANADYMGTRLVYSTTRVPTNITDGTFIANYVSGTEIAGLTNDVVHYFRLFPYDTSNNYNTESGQSVEGVPKAYQLYGVQIDVNNSNPQTAVTYTDMAVGFTPAFCNNGNWQMGSWEDKFPFNEIKPCVLNNGVVQYYLNPNDYTQKITGGASDITSGNDGDVMVEFPKIYWKFERVGSNLYVRYSDVQIDASYKCLAHTIGSKEKDKIYVSAYRGFSTGGKLRSLSGKTPTGTQTIGTFRTLAQANGTGYQQMCYYPLLMLQVLAIVMGKNRDSQTQLGRGFVDGNSAATNTGQTNSKGMFYGENTGKLQNKFCGIEDFYGNQYLFIDGMYSDASRNMMISNQSVFNDTGSGYINYGVGATANVSGYIGSVQGGTETGFIVKTSNGSATTHYSDNGSLDADRLPAFGGIWASADVAGAFALLVNLTASSSYASYGGSLCFIGS